MKYIKILTNGLGLVDGNVLRSGHQHVSVNDVATIKVVRTRIKIRLMCVYIIPQLKNRMVLG